MQVAGARVFVAGGAHRVGRALVLGLAERGARVCFSYHRSAAAAEATLAELRRGVPEARAFRADAGKVEQIQAAVRAAAEALGGLDVLVYAVSGGFRGVPPEQLDEATFDEAVDTTLKGGFFCGQAAYRALGERGGVIVYLTDVAGLEPWPLFAAHGAAKAGLIHLVKTLARAWAPRVRVVGVAPGPVLMPAWTGPESHRRSAEETVLGRLGSPEDVVSAVAFLIEADYVTGSQIVVDGGKLVR